jgi:hypothetical protein
MTEIRTENDTSASAAARASLQAVLDRFDPESAPTYESTQDYYYHGGRKFYWMGKRKVMNKNPAADIWGWKEGHFDWGKRWEHQFSGDSADPDGDGVANIFERAFGWDPNNGTDALPTPTDESGLPPVEHHAGVAVTVETEGGSSELKAVRTTFWPTPIELDPDRPAIVR